MWTMMITVCVSCDHNDDAIRDHLKIKEYEKMLIEKNIEMMLFFYHKTNPNCNSQ